MLSVIMPTYGRPERAVETVRRFKETSGDNADMIVVVDGGDSETYTALCDASFPPGGMLMLTVAKTYSGPVSLWNYGATLTNADLLVLGADDAYFLDDWYDRAMKLYKPGHLLSMADTHSLATHYMVDREFIRDYLGGVFAVPHYFSQYIDVEATRRATIAGRMIWPDTLLWEHRHHTNGLATKDATYRIGDEWMRKDQIVFQDRQAHGFPNDYEPII